MSLFTAQYPLYIFFGENILLPDLILQLSGRHLVALDLDHILDPVHDEDVAILVRDNHVTCPEPVSGEGFFVGLLIVKIPSHQMRGPEQRLNLEIIPRVSSHLSRSSPGEPVSTLAPVS